MLVLLDKEHRPDILIDFMIPNSILEQLSATEIRIIESVKEKATALLDRSPRFRYFTLHGAPHIDSLFRILGILIESGIKLPQRELYLLCLSICTHDLGMVVSLVNLDFETIAQGRPGFSDPVAFERFVRETHHDLINQYIGRDFNFLVSLGVTPPDLTTIAAIGRAHRKVNLDELTGLEQRLGALMRTIDELDIGPNRAPAEVFINIADELDSLSCWHWFKHNITLDWDLNHNVVASQEGQTRSVTFSVAVRPPAPQSIPYWLTQVHRPIRKALIDEGAASIIERSYGIQIIANRSDELSRPSGISGIWTDLENRALSQGRKVIVIVDDEVSKYDDVFYPLMDKYHVIRAPNPRAALLQVQAVAVSAVLVDLQMGDGGLWNEQETAGYKLTGLKLIETLNESHPEIKVGIWTGTRHPIPNLDKLKLSFLARKPQMPDELCAMITNAIESTPTE